MPKSASEIPAQHRDKAHAPTQRHLDEACGLLVEIAERREDSARIIADALSSSAATARAEGRAEGLAAAARCVSDQRFATSKADETPDEMFDRLAGVVRALGAVPQVGTGSEYELGLRRAAEIAERRAELCGGLDGGTCPKCREANAVAHLIRAELPTDAPQEPAK